MKSRTRRGDGRPSTAPGSTSSRLLPANTPNLIPADRKMKCTSQAASMHGARGTIDTGDSAAIVDCNANPLSTEIRVGGGACAGRRCWRILKAQVVPATSPCWGTEVEEIREFVPEKLHVRRTHCNMTVQLQLLEKKKLGRAANTPSIARAVWKLMVAVLRYLGPSARGRSIRIATDPVISARAVLRQLPMLVRGAADHRYRCSVRTGAEC